MITCLHGQQDSLYLRVDSLSANRDSTSIADFLPKRDSSKTGTPSASYVLSPDAVDVLIDYGAKDSLILDRVKNKAYLYGNAYAKYENFNLTADYIVINLDSSIAEAFGVQDEHGHWVGLPHFEDGEQNFDAHRLRYNFKSRKGKIYEVRTQQNDLYILGSETKMIARLPGVREKDVGYSRNAIFTTCNHPEPHFGIRSSKQKVIANEVGVVGSSFLEIEGVPTPLWLPFGFFPLTKGARSGLIFPKDYEYSPRWGYGLSGIGYYVPISDQLSAKFLTDFYLRGSYVLQGSVNYKKIYKYQGSVGLSFSNYREEIDDSNKFGRSKSWKLKIIHNQDPKAHPYNKLGGNIDIQTGNYNRLNNTSYNSVYNSVIQSNMNFTRVIPNSPFTLTASMQHSQDLNKRDMNITFPSVQLKMRTINPFKSKKVKSKPAWFEQITLGYNAATQLNFRGTDTTFFTEQTWDDSRFGVKQTLNTAMPFNVLKYISVSPSASLTETWYTRHLDYMVIDQTERDSLGNMIYKDSLATNRVDGFRAIHQYNFGVSASTSIYNTLQIKNGWLRGLRYTMRPSISLSRTPDYTRVGLDYFQRVDRIDDEGNYDESLLNRFSNEIYGSPSRSTGNFNINYSISNVLEGKFFNAKEQETKIVKLLNNFSVSGFYTVDADSLNWSTVRASGTARFLKSLVTVKLDGTWDPYTTNEEGTRINTYNHKAGGALLRFVGFNWGVTSSFRIRDIEGLFNKDVASKPKKQAGKQKASWRSLFESLQFRYSYRASLSPDTDGKLEYNTSSNSISMRGAIPLTPKWNFNLGNLDYNFITKRTSYPDLGFSRDLHCWVMGLSWQPVAGTYTFYLNVKPGTLGFIKVPYKQNRADGFNSF